MKKGLILLVLFSFFLIFSSPAHAAGRLFYTDEGSGNIVELDPDSGAVLNSFASPISFGDGCVGLAFAADRLFISVCGSNIYEVNPSTGALVNTISIPGVIIDTDGLGFSGTELYVMDYEASLIYVLNPDTGALIRTLNPGVGIIGGISYAGGRNSLFVTNSDVEPSVVYEINAATGAIINSFQAPGDIYGVGFSFARGTLYLGDVPILDGDPETGQETATGEGNAGHYGRIKASSGNTIYEVNPDTGAVINTLPFSPIWGLATDEWSESGPVSSIPTMNEWGMIIFMILAGMGSILYIRKKKTTFEAIN